MRTKRSIQAGHCRRSGSRISPRRLRHGCIDPASWDRVRPGCGPPPIGPRHQVRRGSCAFSPSFPPASDFMPCRTRACCGCPAGRHRFTELCAGLICGISVGKTERPGTTRVELGKTRRYSRFFKLRPGNSRLQVYDDQVGVQPSRQPLGRSRPKT